MATPRSAWGIDVGNRALKAVKVVRGADGLRVDDVAVLEHEHILSNAGDNKESLIQAALQQFVSIFECFLSDVCRAWLLAFPVGIARRQLNGREILSLPDKPAIIDALIEKELRDVFYDRPSNWFGYLNNLVSLGAPTQKDVESFSEIKATRDILVHGQGIANAYYVDKSGKAARVRLGEPINVPEPYHQQSWTLICKLVRDIGDGMAAKA